VESELVLDPGARTAVPTGLVLEIPAGFEGQVRPRSGLAFKAGLTVVNAPGTIDSDYRGELKVLMVNLGSDTVSIGRGDRIAQLLIAPVTRASFTESDDLSASDRGDGGFGSTGV
jgi:dUTP pyrophosphatase